jgi:hypothetical protein
MQNRRLLIPIALGSAIMLPSYGHTQNQEAAPKQEAPAISDLSSPQRDSVDLSTPPKNDITIVFRLNEEINKNTKTPEEIEHELKQATNLIHSKAEEITNLVKSLDLDAINKEVENSPSYRKMIKERDAHKKLRDEEDAAAAAGQDEGNEDSEPPQQTDEALADKTTTQ